jgi:RNA recognition motif-containing protein
MKLYVGNLSYEVTEGELAAEFGVFGKVESVAVPSDKFSGRPRGFAFVDMPVKTEADAAITGLNGKMLKDRTIVVNESKPKTDTRSSNFGPNKRPGSSFGGGRGGSRGGGRSGGRPGGGGRDRY